MSYVNKILFFIKVFQVFQFSFLQLKKLNCYGAHAILLVIEFQTQTKYPPLLSSL